ncbi:MAG: hypothetical protein WC496_05290 [Phycisphaerae bacterium]|jgi:hypothetical protein
MKKFILFLTCFVISAAMAEGTDNAGNTQPQKPADPCAIKAVVQGSKDSNMLNQQQKAAREKMIKSNQPVKMDQAAAERQMARSKEHVQQRKAFESQLSEEYQKHNRRIAILQRIRQLAEENNLTDKIQKVDELIKMETGRHRKTIMQLHQKPAAASPTFDRNETKK